MENTSHPAGRKAPSPGFIQMGEALPRAQMGRLRPAVVVLQAATDAKRQHAAIGRLVKMCKASPVVDKAKPRHHGRSAQGSRPAAMSELVVIDASVLLAIPLPDPKPNKEYALALLYAIDKGDVAPVLTQLLPMRWPPSWCARCAARSRAATAREFFESLSFIAFQHVVDVRDFDTLFNDAMALGCGSYDASYLRAALDNNAQLATLDKKLMPHLVANGVQRWESVA